MQREKTKISFFSPHTSNHMQTLHLHASHLNPIPLSHTMLSTYETSMLLFLSMWNVFHLQPFDVMKLHLSTFNRHASTFMLRVSATFVFAPPFSLQRNHTLWRQTVVDWNMCTKVRGTLPKKYWRVLWSCVRHVYFVYGFGIVRSEFE